MKYIGLAAVSAAAFLFVSGANAAPAVNAAGVEAVAGAPKSEAQTVYWHNRWRSHYRWGSHGGWHNRWRSHHRWGSRW